MQVSLTNYIINSPSQPTVPQRGPALPNPDGSRPSKPSWIRAPLPAGGAYTRMKAIVDEHALHTVCQSAACPNIGECWNRGAATFMILGNICTRNCGFCNVATGRPLPVDRDEPYRIARAMQLMHVRYAVITSVNRDELPGRGSDIWAETIRQVRLACPQIVLETLIPDYSGDELTCVLRAHPGEGYSGPAHVGVDGCGPDVLAHNLECVPRISRVVRAQSKHEKSIRTLREAKQHGFVTKTGLMLGLGETHAEVREVIDEAVSVGVDILTLGQYLQPSPGHLRVERFCEPAEFEELKRYALGAGIRACEAGPMVRSSYYAENTGQEVLALIGRLPAAASTA